MRGVDGVVEESGTAGPESQRVEILLIDDNTDYLHLIQKALERHDPRYHVTGVSSPEEAYELLDRQPFHLLLLDYKFPRGNGLQVFRNLKDKLYFVPTVMVTAFGDEGLAIQCMREGALDFVPKTADFMQALPEVVSRSIERGRTIRERIRTRTDLERKNRELQLLNDIATAISVTHDPDEIAQQAALRLREFLGAARSNLQAGGADAPTRESDRRDVHVVHLGGERRLVVPLVRRDQVVGVLTFAPVGEVSPADRAACASVAAQVAVAVEHARLYRALAETEHYLQDIVANAGDEIVTIDSHARIITWNAGAEAIYGWTCDEVVGRGWDLLWRADRAAEAQGFVGRVLAGETLATFETVRVTRDGTLVDILLTLSPLRGPEGNVRGVSCLGKNVTYQKQLQAQLVQSEKMAAVGQLISGVAHELNNPLTGVLGYAQLVATADTGEKLPIYLERIATEASRCQRIVHNLLTFARKHEPRAERISLNAVVQGTLELREYDLRVNNVELASELAPDLPTTLADPNQLQQVIVNLITNAQHAIAKAKGSGRIVVRTFLDEAGLRGRPSLCISVEDDGPGIPEDLRKKVFDPFFTTKDAAEGTGLGLSISYGIIQQHGGEISVLASPAGGACVQFRVPVHPDLAGASPEKPRVVRTPLELGQKRILVVDDQPSIREIFADILARDGHEIHLAEDGRQALSRINGGEHYDLIIVDLRMPDLDGDELYDEVCMAHPELAGRMVFASGDVVSEDTRRFLERAGNKFLAKPFGVEDVRSTVSAFFEEHQ